MMMEELKEIIFEHFNKQVEDSKDWHETCQQENGQDALHMYLMYMSLGSRDELAKLIAAMGWEDDCYEWAFENFGEDKKHAFRGVLKDFSIKGVTG